MNDWPVVPSGSAEYVQAAADRGGGSSPAKTYYKDP